jgi:hypothetical protein
MNQRINKMQRYILRVQRCIDKMQPEHWEYKAFGVINDDEIGQASDIVEVVFGL